MNKISEMKMEFDILVEKNQFTDDEDDVDQDQVDREVKDLKADMDAAIKYIEIEDNIRALYTLDITPVTDPVKLPKFSGRKAKTSTNSGRR